MKELFLDLLRSFLEAGIRFWDNRFKTSDEDKNWLHLALEAERRERNELINKFLDMQKPVPQTVSNEEEMRPLRQEVNWKHERNRLIREDRAKAREISEKLREEFEKTKSTEQLEKELDIA